MIRGAGAVGAFLLTDHEEQIDALLAGVGEALGSAQHCRSDALRVARTTAVEPFSLETRGQIRRHSIEVRGQRDTVTSA